MGTGYFNKDSMLSPSELDEKGIKAKKTMYILKITTEK